MLTIIGVAKYSAMGKSRSATLVIAYMLAKNLEVLDPSSALDRLRGVREIVEPNDGFARQLELYYSMKCPANIGAHPAYQRWLFQQEVESSVACGRAPDMIRFEDEAIPSGTDTSLNASENGTFGARCRKCRRVLATETYIHKMHSPKPSSATQAARLAAEGPIGLDSASTSDLIQNQCAHVFLDPLSWMRSELEKGKLEGRLECPGNTKASAGPESTRKCGANIGKYAWQGMRCSCGQWVVPAFSLARTKIDIMKSPGHGQVIAGKM